MADRPEGEEPMNQPLESRMWTFLTNHAHVLLCLVRDPEMRMRDIADVVGITERGVQKIVADLVAEGYLHREREGRCNKYRIDTSRPLRHPIERHRSIADLIGLVHGSGEEASKPNEEERSSWTEGRWNDWDSRKRSMRS